VALAAAFGVRMLVVGNAGPQILRTDLAKQFFERYVDGDGRVVRRDQGSDTVSEGQAYAMLLAVALDDPSAFDRVWGWARRELQRPDGLLSWHWAGGRATDPQSASDADIDAATALLLAGDRFGRPGDLKEARRIADAIVRQETIRVGRERVLVAGPWARDQRVVNPSYFSPESFRRFADAFDDGRWLDLRDSSLRIMRNLTADGKRAPPDWAVFEGKKLVGTDQPPGGGVPSGGLDAARVLVRFAATCDGNARSLAGSLRPRVESWGATGHHPLEIVAAAAAAGAAGADELRDTLLDRADSVVRSHPTYYGWSWVALGRAMLDPHALFRCGRFGLAAEFLPGTSRALAERHL
jgi:endoglucanase